MSNKGQSWTVHNIGKRITFGPTSVPWLHGVISDTNYYYRASDSFIIYDGSSPEKYSNPLGLATGVVSAISPPDAEDPWGETPETLPKIKEVRTGTTVLGKRGNYIGYYGHTSPWDRLYKYTYRQGVNRGRLQYNKKRLEMPHDVASDVALIAGKIHILNMDSASAILQGVPVIYYLTMDTSGNIEYLKRARIQYTHISGPPYAIGVFSIYLYDYVTDQETLVYSSANNYTPPGGYEPVYDGSGGPGLIMDARFSPDNNKISLLLGHLEAVWLKELPFEQAMTYEWSKKAFSTCFDLVLWRDSVGVEGIVTADDPYGTCSVDTPIVGRAYEFESISMPTEISLTVETHEDMSDAKSAGWVYGYYGGSLYHSSLFSSSTGSVTCGPPASSTLFSKEEEPDWNLVFEPLEVHGTDVSASWAGPCSVEWEEENNTTAKFISSSAVLTRTVNISYKDANGQTQSTSVEVTRVAERQAVWEERFEAVGTIKTRYSGLLKFGYHFDSDKNSLTYNQRYFIEMGFLQEPLGVVNNSLEFEVKHTISNNVRYRAQHPEFLTKISQNSSHTMEVTKGGCIQHSLYLNGVAIQRSNYTYIQAQGLKRECTYSSEEIPGDGPIPWLGDRHRKYSNKYTPGATVLWSGTANFTSSNFLRYYSGSAIAVSTVPGGTNYELGAGVYNVEMSGGLRLYQSSQVDSLDPTTYPYHDSIKVPQYKQRESGGFAVVVNGRDILLTAAHSDGALKSGGIDSGGGNLEDKRTANGDGYSVLIHSNPTFPDSPDKCFINFWDRVTLGVPQKYAFYNTEYIPRYTFEHTTFVVEDYGNMWGLYEHMGILPYDVEIEGEIHRRIVVVYGAPITVEPPAYNNINKSGIAILDTLGNILSNTTDFPNGKNGANPPTGTYWRTEFGYILT